VEELGAHAPDKVKATLMALFCRVEIRSDRVDITLSRGRLTQLLAGSLDLKMQHQEPTSAPDDLLGLTVPVGLKRVGREMRMLVENASATNTTNAPARAINQGKPSWRVPRPARGTGLAGGAGASHRVVSLQKVSEQNTKTYARSIRAPNCKARHRAGCVHNPPLHDRNTP
jgi:hypothetical protein